MSTVKKIMYAGAGLIALYLVVYYYIGTTSDLGAASSGSVSLIKAFQGR
jgi:hypothetical protein